MKLVPDNDNQNITGPHLKAARLKSNLTQQQLYAKLKTVAVYTDRASISKIKQQETDCNLLRIISPLPNPLKALPVGCWG